MFASIPFLMASRTCLVFAALFLLSVGLLRAQRLPSTTEIKPLSYAIALTDRLRISVYQEDDLSIIARVDAKGCVNLPLVGEVQIAGLSIADAQRVVEAAYREGRYLRHPQVTINVEEYAPREISVQGQVRSPGRIPLPIESTMTIFDAVSKAGGLTDTARGSAVTVTRVLPDGTKQTFVVDVESLIKGRNRADVQKNSLLLQPGDIVYVPERII